jgi:hypothetical protein
MNTSGTRKIYRSFPNDQNMAGMSTEPIEATITIAIDPVMTHCYRHVAPADIDKLVGIMLDAAERAFSQIALVVEHK